MTGRHRARAPRTQLFGAGIAAGVLWAVGFAPAHADEFDWLTDVFANHDPGPAAADDWFAQTWQVVFYLPLHATLEA